MLRVLIGFSGLGGTVTDSSVPIGVRRTSHTRYFFCVSFSSLSFLSFRLLLFVVFAVAEKSNYYQLLFCVQRPPASEQLSNLLESAGTRLFSLFKSYTSVHSFLFSRVCWLPADYG